MFKSESCFSVYHKDTQAGYRYMWIYFVVLNNL